MTKPNNINLPDWFKLATGFRYLGPDGCPCVIIGVGRFNKPEDRGELTVDGKHYTLTKPGCTDTGIWVVCGYKGNFVINDISGPDYDQTYFNNCHQMTPEQANPNLMLRLTLHSFKFEHMHAGLNTSFPHSGKK